MTDIVFLQTKPDRIVVGSGILTWEAAPSPSAPTSFYINDFFLTKEKPWLVASVIEELTLKEFSEKYAEHAPAISKETFTWHTAELDKFKKFFYKIKQAIDQRLIEKIVPVIFEHASIPEELRNHEIFSLTRSFLPFCKDGLLLHGYQIGGTGRCGLTPEVLAEYEESILTSYALAGTKLSASGDKSLSNPKDAREHQLVIDDIASVLKIYGSPSVGKISVSRIGSLAHLKATVSVQTRSIIPLAEIVATLHPTAALGVYPRSRNASIIFRSSDSKQPREEFAAPFGVQYLDGRATCVSSIRSCFWKNGTIKIGAGCGIIEESELEAEITELQMKLNSVKNRLSN